MSKGYSLLLLLLLQVSLRWTEFVPSAQIASSLRTSSTLTKAWTTLGTSFPRWASGLTQPPLIMAELNTLGTSFRMFPRSFR